MNFQRHTLTQNGRRGVQRMTPQEYQQKLEAPFFFLRPRGFCKGPEFTIPYIQLAGISQKEAIRLQKEIRRQMQWQSSEAYTSIEENQFSIHFENHYDAKTGKIDNEMDWQRILVGVQYFLQGKEKNWRSSQAVNESTVDKLQYAERKVTYTKETEEINR